MNKRILIAISCAASLVTAHAFAQSDARRKLVVPYSDLDVTHEAGAHTLLARIEHAARAVCGPEADIRDLEMTAQYRTCYKDAVGHAVADANVPLVSELYLGPVPAVAQNSGASTR